MKKRSVNRIDRGPRVGLVATVAIVVLAAVVTGVALGYDSLHRLYLEQCVVSDPTEQVEIRAGRMVRAEVIAEHFGLKAGANLAEIDFAAKRADLLARVPTLRSISIEKHLPDRVVIIAEERTPVARMELKASRAVSGRVTDAEGVVFNCRRGTDSLPVIREVPTAPTAVGSRLAGRAKDALELMELSRDAEFSDLGVLEADASGPDYVTLTLSNYSKVKILWDDRDDLIRRLTNLRRVFREQVSTGVKIWNATLPDRIFADTQEKL